VFASKLQTKAQAERQRKQILSDKKLQAVIARDEKARKTEERKLRVI
jgi:hypothetical protein